MVSGCSTKVASRSQGSTSRCCVPRRSWVRGVSLDGEIIEIEADELEARMFQHEIDHLNGVLMFDRLEGDQRKEAMREYRRMEEQAAAGSSNVSRCVSVSVCPELVRLMKIVYLGTPEMAVPPLQALHAAGPRNPARRHPRDKKRGRGSALSPSPVKAAALELGIPVSHETRRRTWHSGRRRHARCRCCLRTSESSRTSSTRSR